MSERSRLEMEALMSCCELIQIDTAHLRYSLCGAPGERVVLSTPAGRSPASGGPYCEQHGGTARARREAESDWNYLAPECVGNDQAVLEAGCESLRSPDAVVVVRPEHGRWLAWCGIGSMLERVPNPHARIRKRGRRGGAGPWRDSGRCAFPSQEAALEIALQVWRQRLEAHVAQIREMRGGTLDWGVSVSPLDRPAVYILGAHGSAWDATPTHAAVSRARVPRPAVHGSEP